MAIGPLDKNEILKLKEVINQGIKIKQDIAALSEGLRETIKEVATEVDVKPRLISKSINSAVKANLLDEKEKIDDVETLLKLVGINNS